MPYVYLIIVVSIFSSILYFVVETFCKVVSFFDSNWSTGTPAQLNGG